MTLVDELHRAACRAATRAVPEFEIGSAPHEQWLAEYLQAAATLVALTKAGLLQSTGRVSRC